MIQETDIGLGFSLREAERLRDAKGVDHEQS